jgi:dipeptidyl aminopeptidase/acylaminoacyl peptidase
MQNSLQLLDLLLDAGKTVELMIYPNERHGIRGKRSNRPANVEF